jgi:predicted ArsR family transcriptional regulator
MIEITTGTLEERIIRFLQKTYPVTIYDVKNELNVSKKMVERVLHKFQVKNIVQLEPLSDRTYIRLLRNDFRFIGRKQQQHKFIKHNKNQEPDEYDDIMYS